MSAKMKRRQWRKAESVMHAAKCRLKDSGENAKSGMAMASSGKQYLAASGEERREMAAA
jgi:hypothetical protein